MIHSCYKRVKERAHPRKDKQLLNVWIHQENAWEYTTSGMKLKNSFFLRSDNFRIATCVLREVCGSVIRQDQRVEKGGRAARRKAFPSPLVVVAGYNHPLCTDYNAHRQTNPAESVQRASSTCAPCMRERENSSVILRGFENFCLAKHVGR